MTTQRLGICLALVVLLLPASCSTQRNSSSYTLGTASGPPAEDSGLIEVTMRPAQPVVPPFAADADKLVSAPSELLGVLPTPADAARRVSFEQENLVLSGSEYSPLLPNHMVIGPSDYPGSLLFEPTWQPGDGPSEMAFAAWNFELPGYSESGENQTLGISAELLLPAVQHSLWVGFGNFDTDRWDWYEYEEDGVITVESFAPYESVAGNIIAILIGLSQPVKVNHLHIGVSEMRATGETYIPFTPPQKFPDFPLTFDFFFDISSDCSPINDQGGIGSCTAMATADGALNYELGQVYAACNWNFADARLCSPRFVYNQTGADFGKGCPTAGRSTNQVGDWLVDNGTSSEFNAPYGSLSSSLYDCGTGWSAEALADAELLNADAKHFIGTPHPTGSDWHWDNADIESVKTLIRVARKPVVFRSDLDASFGAINYAGGDSWTYSGPKTGGHAMMVVGYDDDRNGGSFKVRNSWGTDFGDDGHCWISYDSMRSSTAGVYGFYFQVNWDEDVADRFCPGPPMFLPPFGFKFLNPQPFGIVLEWDLMPGAERYLIFRDSQISPIGFASETENTWMDGNVPDNLTHVYWIKAVYGQTESPFSPPIFGYQSSD